MIALEIVIPAGVLLAVAAFVLGRVTASGSKRLTELQSTLDDALGEREQARSEAAAAAEDRDAYKQKVGDHFAETSHRLHDLTLQYRSVYDHLAAGAEELCPEGFQKLEGGLGLDALPEGDAASEAAETPSPESPAFEAEESPLDETSAEAGETADASASEPLESWPRGDASAADPTQDADSPRQAEPAEDTDSLGQAEPAEDTDSLGQADDADADEQSLENTAQVRNPLG